MNSAFASLFDEFNAVYAQYGDPTPITVAIDLKAGVGSNRMVFGSLSITEHFAPFRFDLPAASATPTLNTPASSSIFSAELVKVATVAEAAIPSTPSRSFSFELHRFWHANVSAGFAFSRVSSPDYVKRAVTVDGVTTNQIVANGQKARSAYIPLGIIFYPQKQDTYPRTGLSRTWGIFGGVGIGDASNYFLGGVYEPVPGVNVSAGLHSTQITKLQLGVNPGDTLSDDAEVPMRKVSKVGPYLMFGLDLNIFQTVFGKLPAFSR